MKRRDLLLSRSPATPCLCGTPNEIGAAKQMNYACGLGTKIRGTRASSWVTFFHSLLLHQSAVLITSQWGSGAFHHNVPQVLILDQKHRSVWAAPSLFFLRFPTRHRQSGFFAVTWAHEEWETNNNNNQVEGNWRGEVSPNQLLRNLRVTKRYSCFLRRGWGFCMLLAFGLLSSAYSSKRC